MKKSDRIYLRITPELREAAEKAAAKNGFTLSGFVIWLITQFLLKQGK